MHMPCSQTPVEPPAPGHLGARDVVFRHTHDVDLYDKPDFEARSHGLRPRCLRFAAEVTLAQRKTRFRAAGQPYPDGVGYPRDS